MRSVHGELKDRLGISFRVCLTMEVVKASNGAGDDAVDAVRL